MEHSLYARQFSLRHLLIALTVTGIALAFFDYGGQPRFLLGVTLSLLGLAAGAAGIACLRSGRATIVVASAWLSGFTVAGVYLLHAGFRRRVSNTLPFADDDYILIIAWYATILLVGMGCGWLMSVVRERC